MDVLQRIKELVIRRRVEFTLKALEEMEADNLEPFDVYESILSARLVAIKRSTSARRLRRREMVYLIVAPNYRGVRIYTKGVFRTKDGLVQFYVLISAKRSVEN